MPLVQASSSVPEVPILFNVIPVALALLIVKSAPTLVLTAFAIVSLLLPNVEASPIKFILPVSPITAFVVPDVVTPLRFNSPPATVILPVFHSSPVKESSEPVPRVKSEYNSKSTASAIVSPLPKRTLEALIIKLPVLAVNRPDLLYGSVEATLVLSTILESVNLPPSNTTLPCQSTLVKPEPPSKVTSEPVFNVSVFPLSIVTLAPETDAFAPNAWLPVIFNVPPSMSNVPL